MSSSWSTRMTVTDNFFDNVRGGGVSWANRDPWPLRFSFMTLRRNAFTGIHMAYIGVKPEDMPVSGACWWTPWMAACPEAKTTISFKMYGKNIEATDKATPIVYVQFTSATGRQRTRTYLVGHGADGTLHRPELTQGTFGWTEVKKVVTAPQTAERMAVALGILPCKGEVGFDDIDIKTFDRPTPAGETEMVEVKPTVIPKERMREIIYLDLSWVANRSLTDDLAGDGKGGWTDEGPSRDLRKLPTGDRVIGGMPFRIARGPKAVVAVQANPQPGSDVEREVTIPVGRKMEALYVLHASAFLSAKRKMCFDILVNYKDGSTASCQFWPFPDSVVDVLGDGTPVRFWAVNDFFLSDGKPARFWDESTADGRAREKQLDRHARWLAKLGVNMARINGTTLNSKKPGSRATDIEEQAIRDCWRTVAAMKKQGIYSTLMPYWAGHAVDATNWGIDGYSGQTQLWGLLFFNPDLKSAYQCWLKELFTRTNPYTGVPLAKEPAVGLILLQNEDSLLFWTVQGLKPPQQALLGRRAWS